MKTTIHTQMGMKIAEVDSDSILIDRPQDALELLMNLSLQHDVTKFIFHQKSIAPAFFDLKTKLAGEILQKVVNYRLQLAVVGNFENIKSESLSAFILESNQGKQVFFLDSVEAAKQALFSNNV